MATFLYARVSTTEQTLEHQRTQAEQAGFKFEDRNVIADHGVSGVSTRLADRPNGKRLFDMLRSGDVLVVRWIDRLGRNYDDVTAVIREFIGRGVVIKTIINGMTFDGATTDPVQKAVRDALIAFMAATAQAQAEALKVAQKAGIAHAKDKGDVYLGRRPSFSRDQLSMVQNMLSQNAGISAIAAATGLSRQAVYRIQNDPAAAEASMAAWQAKATKRHQRAA